MVPSIFNDSNKNVAPLKGNYRNEVRPRENKIKHSIRYRIHNPSFSSQLLSDPVSYRQCYIPTGWNGLPGTNILACWTYS